MPIRNTCRAIAVALIVAATTLTAGTSPLTAQDASAHPGGGLNPLNWQMPKFQAPKFSMPKFSSLLPGQDEKQRMTKKKDSLFTEIGASARNSWAKTKEVFNPQKLNPANLFKPASTKTQTPKATKPSFFSSLFAPPEDPPERITDVNDFLNQQNPVTAR